MVASRNRRVRVLVADRDRSTRRAIERCILADSEAELVASCESDSAALASILHHAPDLAFLEIAPPSFDPFGLLTVACEKGRALPSVVFMTDEEAYALRAFDVQAIDYLIKPLLTARIERNLLRAKRYLGRTRELFRPPAEQEGRVLVRRGAGMTFVGAHEVHWLEAANHYVHLHTGEEPLTVRARFSDVMTSLGEAQFVRVHRSAAVRVPRVAELRTVDGGRCEVVLEDGTRVPVSRRRVRAVRAALQAKAGGLVLPRQREAH